MKKVLALILAAMMVLAGIAGNGFTFDRYDAGLLLDAVNRAKTVYFTDRNAWDEMVKRNMMKDVSWEQSAKKYTELYKELAK